MIQFKNLSITRKLVIIQLVTTFSAILFYGTFVATNDWRLFRSTLVGGLSSIAELTGANSASALNFLDNAAAEENLRAMEASANLVNAWIYNAEGLLFAKYSKKGFGDFEFPYIKEETHEFKKGFITVTKKIRSADGVLGTVSLRLKASQYQQIFNNNLLVAALALVMGMIVAFLLSTFTHKTISKPILQLVRTVKKVSDTGDYSIRTLKISEDETGALSNGFNAMMEQLQTRESERDKAYLSLQESEKKYRTLFDNMNDGFAYHRLVIDADNRPVDYVFLEVNNAFEQFTGLKKENILGQRVTEVIPGIKKASPNLIQIYGQVALTGEETNFEMYFEPFKKWYSISAYRPEAGYFCTIFKDITEAKKAEELTRIQQQQLIQADKMASLGLLVSGVAHEINNPNNFIQLNSENLAEIWKDAVVILDKYQKSAGDFDLAGLPYEEVRKEAPSLIGSISEGAKRIEKIVLNLKEFSRLDPGSMDQSIQINQLLESAILIVNNLIKKSTNKFEVNYGMAVPAIQGNNQQIEQVLINLISNACQALENKGQGVAVSTLYDDAADQVCVIIKDEGRGIPPENLRHIMDPFFTTKRDEGGTGLGLSISYNIVKDHGGSLQITSGPEPGATAVIRLPAKSKSRKTIGENL
jgi:PAS domain S-box-containing protein